MNIEYSKNIDTKLEKFINDEFEVHSAKNNLLCNYKPFNFIAKEQNKVIGILTGYTIFSEVHIDDLVVSEEYRKNGIGTKLIKKVEEHYNKKGFNNITLETHKFQAPEFYKKCGYTLEFIRENKDEPGLSKYFFVKYF